MPLYDCMVLLKPHVSRGLLMDLVARLGKHVYARNGVITEVKSFGTVQLGYGIKKRDGKFYQGQLVQMTMMATPNINKEFQYLNKEDRLLRWLLVKHRDVNLGRDYMLEDDIEGRLRSSTKDDEDVDDFVGELDDDEYEVENSERK
ncbi:hypothetical protein V2J09_003549 [Rumex salicifolius]